MGKCISKLIIRIVFCFRKFNLFFFLCSIFICNIYEFLELGFIYCYEVILYFIYILFEIYDNELLIILFVVGLFLIIKLCRLC